MRPVNILKILFRKTIKKIIGFFQNFYLYPTKRSATKSNIPFRNAAYGSKIIIEDNVTLKPFNKNNTLKIEDCITICKNCIIHSNSIGKYTYISQGCTIYASKIGSFCSIGSYIGINQARHPINNVSTHGFFYKPQYGIVEHSNVGLQDVRIGHDVWIGFGSYVSGGVNIGTGAIIGAHSVVTKDVPPYAIAMGAPAVVKRYRFEQDIIQSILKTKWWEWEDEILRDRVTYFNDVKKFLEKWV